MVFREEVRREMYRADIDIVKVTKRLCREGLTLKVDGSERVRASHPDFESVSMDSSPRVFYPFINDILNSTKRRYTEEAFTEGSAKAWLKQEEARRMIRKWTRTGGHVQVGNIILSNNNGSGYHG
jgi:hypothetical protein